MIKNSKNKNNLMKAFSLIEKKYNSDDLVREEVIKLSREIIKPSKQAIYAIHRGNKAESLALLKTAEKNISKISSRLKKTSLKAVGSFRASLEEYVEAKTYFAFTYQNKVLTPSNFPSDIHYETYLGGIADFTGEIAKHSVVLATNGEFEKVNEIKICIEEIHEAFLTFNFRSGELRKKAESVKYNLSKVNTILYDISMRKK